MKYYVQAVTREGHDAVWRAGRRWPSGQQVAIEVLPAGEADPMLDVPTQPGQPPRRMLAPDRLSAESFEALKKDGRLSIMSTEVAQGGTNTAELVALRAKLQAAERELRTLRGGGTADETKAAEHKNTRAEAAEIRASVRASDEEDPHGRRLKR